MSSSSLDQLCNSFRTRLKVTTLQAGVCRILILALFTLPAFVLLDWWLNMTTAWRLFVLLTWCAGVVCTYWKTVHGPLAASWTKREILAYIDSVAPDGAGLLEHYELLEGQGIEESESEAGKAMVSVAIGTGDGLINAARESDLIHRTGLLRWAKWAAAGIVLCVGISVLFKTHTRIGTERFFNPFSTTRWPTLTTILVQEPGTGWTVPQMEAFSIEAEVTGVVPRDVVLAYRGESASTWTKEKLRLSDGQRIDYTFPEVRERFELYLEGGDFTSDTYRIEIVERPYIKRIEAHYDYPDYAAVPDRMVESGQLIGLEGTSVTLKWECSMALNKAVFALDGVEPVDIKMSSPTTFEKTILLRDDGSYAIELYEKHGYREAKPERYDIRVTPDNPPEVEILAPGKDIIVTPKASVPISFMAKDDFGLAKVEFMMQIEDAEPVSLTDRITGPLQQSGKSSEGRFNWKLSLSDLPAEGTLKYFVRVQDINPTGRGKAQTTSAIIELVRPSEFHLEALRKAKRLDAEARIAWENQLHAWKLGAKWLEEGTGDENDPVWRELENRQSSSARASSAMEMYLREITEAYEQNDMSREFMATRLGQVTDLLNHLTRELHTPIATRLKQTRPRTANDAKPDRMKQIRSDGIQQFKEKQKLAVLYCERMLRKLYDWRDLQTTLVKATLLHEEQDELLGLTEKIAPKFIGAEIEDLSDEDQDQLLTLAKRQRTLFDVETELENLLVVMRFKASKQKRKSIEEPLTAAYQGLRSRRVNDNLKTAAQLIGNNQPFQIIKNQKAAIQALNLVKGGLFLAGQKTDEDEPITVAMSPSEFADFEDAKIVKTEKADEPKPASTDQPAEVQAMTPQELLDELPVGSDAVSAAIQLTWELQDSVLSRTRYLFSNSTPEEMPRYIRLKLGILLEKQDGALEAIARGVEEAEKSGPPPVHAALAQLKTELEAIRKIVAARLLGESVQRVQSDAMLGLKDLQQFISFSKSVQSVAAENRSREGKDTFGRNYALRGPDLDSLVQMVDGLSHARLLVRDAVRKLEWCSQIPAADIDDALKALAVSHRKQTSDLFARLQSLILSLNRLPQSLSEAGRTVMGDSPLPTALSKEQTDDIAKQLVSAEDLTDLKSRLSTTSSEVERSLQALRDLLEERERPRAKVAAVVEADIKPMTQEELEQMYSPSALRERLMAQKSIPPEVRAIMMKALSKEFPPRYRELLKAYYGSFVDIESKD